MPTDTSERELEALICTDENFRLVEESSTMTRWLRADEFAVILSEAG